LSIAADEAIARPCCGHFILIRRVIAMLSGKSAIVTGSTSGIGLGIARGLAASGANVMLNGFGDAGEIEAIRGDIANGHNIKVLYSGANMTDDAEIAGMIAQAEDAFGGVDILVNNAGIQYVAPIEEFPVEKWNAILAINLSSTFHTTRLAVPGMKKKSWGRIVNIASAHALVASPFKSAYVAAKHGIAGLTKTAALELAEHGITVNAVCPGYVMTPRWRSRSPNRPRRAASPNSRSSPTCCSRRSRPSASSPWKSCRQW
jgi:3-hydroxybutyrate dehydrogenase